MDNRFCVYIHKRLDNGEVFYVGQGTKRRPHEKTRTLEAWNAIVKDTGGFDVEIVKDFLSKNEALELEKELITKYIDTVVNLPYNNSKTIDLDYEYFNQRFMLNADSPSGLSYKQDVRTGVNNCSVRFKAGSHCTSKKADSWMVACDNVTLRTHRIVYLLAHGSIDSSKVIDHINGNPLDNSIRNLREITQQENRRNAKIHSKNTTGVTGVSRLKGGIFQAAVITPEGKKLSKVFNIAKLGEEEALRLAKEWRSTQIALLNDQGAGYTSRHGQ